MKVSVDEAPEASLPLVGFTCSQLASDGTLKVHVKVPPPVLVTVTKCGVLILPFIAYSSSWVLLICMAGDATTLAAAVATGVGDDAETRNVTTTSMGVPSEGLIVTCVV